MIEPELLTEVPAALKRLAKQVVRGFYGVEHALALDVLIRNPCVREEDMQELLKFDRKQLRAVLNTLKADKFVKCRMRVETAPDGKTTRHNYYFINYRWLCSLAHNSSTTNSPSLTDIVLIQQSLEEYIVVIFSY